MFLFIFGILNFYDDIFSLFLICLKLLLVYIYNFPHDQHSLGLAFLLFWDSFIYCLYDNLFPSIYLFTFFQILSS